MDAIEKIRRHIEGNAVALFMKGTPDFPQCGFSMQAVQALRACDAEFAFVDVIAEPEIRRDLPGYSNWPTFPQLFIGGELIGGCDIVLAMYNSGELQDKLRQAADRKPSLATTS